LAIIWRQGEAILPDKNSPPRRRSRARYVFNLLAFTVIAFLLLAWIGYDAAGVIAWTQPVPHDLCCSTPADSGVTYEAVTFRGGGDVTLAGWYVPSQNGAAIILLHGYGNDRVQVLPQAVALAQAGYGVLLYDQRGHGASDPVLRSVGWADSADVARAVTWLQARPEVDPARIGIFGFSVGGQTALRAAARTRTLAAVVADGPGLATAADAPTLTSLSERLTNLGNAIVYQGVAWRTGLPQPTPVVDVIAFIAPRPVLLIATGGADGIEQRLVANYYARALPPKTLWTIPEAGHGGGFRARPAEYARRLIRFYDTALRADGR
jgi:pimeloyl-ACP methyl ester carboxylesterase